MEGLRGAALWARLRQQPDDQTLTSRLQETRDTYAEDRRIFIADLKSGRVLASTDKTDVGTSIAGEAFFTGAAFIGTAISWATPAWWAKGKSPSSMSPARCRRRRAAQLR